MSNVEVLERQIEGLSPNELTEFRRWFLEFDAQMWDRQFEVDVKTGKLDALAEKALREHATGQYFEASPVRVISGRATGISRGRRGDRPISHSHF